MEVLGHDTTLEAYRVAAELGGTRITALIPAATIANGIALTGGRGHQTAYDWIARNQRKIEKTLMRLADGSDTGPIPAMVLVEE